MAGFDLQSTLCEPGAARNEDAVHTGPSSIVVVDGASGLSGRSVMGWESDPQWFSHRLAPLVGGKIADQNASITAAVGASLEELRAEYAAALAAGGLTPSAADYPSASLAVVRATARQLEIFSLGDCTTLVDYTDGTVEAIHDGTVSALDAAVIARMVQLAAANGTVREARELVGDQLRANRALMNRGGGYWITDLTAAGLDHATATVRRLEEVRDVAVMTDGFAAAHDVLHLVGGPSSFLEALRTEGAAALGRRIVDGLDGDPDFERYPRLKHRDDMGVVHAAVRHTP